MPPQHPSSNADDTVIVDPLLRHSTVGADRMVRFRPTEGIERRKSFIQAFTASKGPPQIVIMVMLLALGFGSTIGVVRALQRFGPSGIWENKQASHF